MIDFYGYKFDADGKSPSSLEDMLSLFELLRPKASPKPLKRIGDNKDGSYLVPDDLDQISACFSPGVNNFKYFEDTMVRDYGIDCHMCDYSSDIEKFTTPLMEGHQTFLKKWLSPLPGEDNIQLDHWIAEKAPAGDLLLQIDIEGAEYLNILSASDDALARFRIIVLEVHSMSAITNATILREVLAPFFQKLAHHFVPVHAHPNNCCGDFAIPGTGIRIPQVLELTYLRKDRVTEPTFPPLLPHPLDVSRNVPSKQPLFLGEEWLDGGRPVESRLKLLEDSLDALKDIPDEATVANQGLLAKSTATLHKKLALAYPAPDGLRDVAAGKKYALSSAIANAPHAGVVTLGNPFFFHTGFGINQFIKIDLEEGAMVRGIQIRNRLDGFYNRASSLYLILSQHADGLEGDTFCLPASKSFATGQDKELKIDLPPTAARFVTIISPIRTALHFSEIKVLAG